MAGFVGRRRELDKLRTFLARVESGGRMGRPGRCILMRGRRRVGKSRPLTVADTAGMLDLPPAVAVDAHLITGGFPMVSEEWTPRTSVWDHLGGVLDDSLSALVANGVLTLSSEFPPEAHARTLLTVIGRGSRTYSSMSRAVGDLPPTSLKRALQLLLEKRMIVAELPLSTRSSREIRYHVADTHLRFWLAFIGPHMAEIDRGRGDLVLNRIKKSWTSWRGMAVEPLIRESLRRMDGLPEETGAIGGYWTRVNDVEIDIVGADREPVAKKITMAGSVKWLEDRPFDQHDLAELIVQRSRLPGADTTTPLYAVARSGATVSEGVTVVTPEDLVAAWR